MKSFSWFILGVLAAALFFQVFPAFAQEALVTPPPVKTGSTDWVSTMIGDNGAPFVAVIWILSKLVERLKGFEASAKAFMTHQGEYLKLKEKFLEKDLESNKDFNDSLKVIAQTIATGHGFPVDVRGSIYTKLDPSGGHDPESLASGHSGFFVKSAPVSRMDLLVEPPAEQELHL